MKRQKLLRVSLKNARVFKIADFYSNDFLSDQTLQMVGSSEGTLYLNSLR